MKKLLILLLLFMTTVVYSQTRIGFSKEEISMEFKNHDKIFYDSVKPYLVVEFHFGSFAYFFNDQMICDYCLLRPANQKFLEFLVEKYNDEYRIIKEDQWETKERLSLKINLVYDEVDKFSYFTYKQ